MTSFIERKEALGLQPAQIAPAATPQPGLSFVERREQQSLEQARALMSTYRNTTSQQAIEASNLSRDASRYLGGQVAPESFLQDLPELDLAGRVREAQTRESLRMNRSLAPWATRDPVNAILFREHGNEISTLRAAYEVAEYAVSQMTGGLFTSTLAQNALSNLRRAEGAAEAADQSFFEILNERRREVIERKDEIENGEDAIGMAVLDTADKFLSHVNNAIRNVTLPLEAGSVFVRSRLFEPSEEELAALRQVAATAVERDARMQESIEARYTRSAAYQRTTQRMTDAVDALKVSNPDATRWEVFTAQADTMTSNPLDALGFLLTTVGESSGIMAAGVAATVLTRNPTAGAVAMGGMSTQYAYQLSVPDLAKSYGYDLSKPEDVRRFVADPRSRNLITDRAAAYALTLGVVDGLSGGVASQTLAKTVAGNMLLQGLTQAAMGSGGEALARMASDQEFDLMEIALEGLAEFVTVPVEVSLVGGQSLNLRLKEQRKAREAQALFAALADGTANSELRGAVPEKYQELVTELTKNGPVATVEIDTGGLNELFQSGTITPEKLVELVPNLTLETLQQAVDDGAMLSIPTGIYAAKIAGTDIDVAFRKHLSVNGSLTPTQADALMDVDLQAEVAARIADIQSGVRQVTETFERARTELIGGLLSAAPTMTAEMAEAQITPMLVFAEVTAEQQGQDFDTFVKQFVLPRFSVPTDSKVTVPVDQLREVLNAGGREAMVIQNVMDAAGLDPEASNAEIAAALTEFTNTGVGEAEGAEERIVAREVLRRTMNQSSVGPIRNPIDLPRRRGGRPTVWDFAVAFTDRQRAEYGRELDTINNPDDFRVTVDAMVEEFNEQATLMESGYTWYTDDIADAIAMTGQVIPEILEKRELQDLFIVTAAILSPSERPVPNWEKAIQAFVPYVQTGRLAETKATFNDKGQPASFGTNAQGLQLLQYLIDTKGEAGAAAWLMTTHDEAEMTDIRRDSGVFTPDKPRSAYRPKEMLAGETGMLGTYMFGPKVGDFAVNSTGIDPDAITVDLWLGRTYRRITGQLLNSTPEERAKFIPAANPTNRTERDAMKAVVRAVAERVRARPSEVQAVLWYYEQRLYREHGINASSQNFKDAAATAAAARGFGDSEGDDAGAGAEARPELLNVPVTEADLRPKAGVGLGLAFFQRPGWAILTADDTSLDPRSRDVTNAREREMLRNELIERGIPYREARGFYDRNTTPENSFIILADEETARELGKKFRQDSVLTRAGLVYTTNVRPDTRWTGRILRGQEAVDSGFYTRMEDGTIFALELDFATSGPGVPVQPLGMKPAGEDRPQLFVDDEGMVHIFHISPTEGITRTDPSKAGTGPMTSNARRAGIKGTYFGTNMRRGPRDPGTGYVREKKLGDNVYTARIDPKRIYPTTDPDGIFGDAKQEADMLGKALAAGYDGIYTVTGEKSRMGNVVLLGKPIEVEPTTADAMYLPPAPPEEPAATEDEGVQLYQPGIPEGYRLPDLERSSPGPVPGVRESATRYMQAAGLPVRHQATYVKVDVTRAQLIAQLYERAEDRPNDPEVREAYEQLAKEVIAQYEALTELGITFEWITGDDPYSSPADAIRDMQENQHLFVFPTTDGYGAEGGIPNADDNPMLRETEYTIDGRKALVNDLFRIVHDVYGHGSEGAAFGPRGEENAWQAHVRMFSPLAARAMTSETRGQNSWVNYGPLGEQNRANPKETVFADQKVTLLPEWVSQVGQANDMPLDAEGNPVLPRMMRSVAPPRTFFQSANRPVFHSAMVNFLETAKQDQALPKDWLAILSKAPGVKELELVWTDVYDFLQTRMLNQPKMQVTRNELLGRAQQGFSRLVPDFREGPGRFNSYVERGPNEKYVELLGIVPGLETVGPNDRRVDRDLVSPFVHSGHFDEENVAVHIRATHRGETFFVEEVQSDLNSDLRKAEIDPTLEELKATSTKDTEQLRREEEAKRARIAQLEQDIATKSRYSIGLNSRILSAENVFRDTFRKALIAMAQAAGDEGLGAMVKEIGRDSLPGLRDAYRGRVFDVFTRDGGAARDFRVWSNQYTDGEGQHADVEMLARVYILQQIMAWNIPMEAAFNAAFPDTQKALVELWGRMEPQMQELDAVRAELEAMRAEFDRLTGFTAGWENGNGGDALPWTPLPGELAVAAAMKKAIFYAAENGFKRLQWTPAAAQGRRWQQQVEQVNEAVVAVSWTPRYNDGTRRVDVKLSNGSLLTLWTLDDGTTIEEARHDGVEMLNYRQQQVAALLGDELADQIKTESRGNVTDPEVRFRSTKGEGYINVYDRQMRKVADKVVKPFGLKVEVAKRAVGRGGPSQSLSSAERVKLHHAAIFSGVELPSRDPELFYELGYWTDYEWWSWTDDALEARNRAIAVLEEMQARDWRGVNESIRSGLSFTAINARAETMSREMGITRANAFAGVILDRLAAITTSSTSLWADQYMAVQEELFPGTVAYPVDSSGDAQQRVEEDVWEIEITEELRRSVLSNGFTLYQSRTESEAFRRWFGESVVRTFGGNPMVLYHATDATENFPGFATMQHFGTQDAANDRAQNVGMGVARVGGASDRRRLIPVYVRIKRPLPLGRERSKDDDFWMNDHEMWEQVIDHVEGFYNFKTPDQMHNWARRARDLSDNLRAELDVGAVEGVKGWEPWRQEMAALLEELGFDGITYVNTVEGPGQMSYIPLRPEQVKSIWNSGRWDGNNPDMLAQENRGSITLPPPGQPGRQAVITLMTKPDESTVIHESAHWFLYVYEELVMSGAASPRIAESYSRLKTWWHNEADAVAAEAQKELPAVTADDVRTYLAKGATGNIDIDAAVYRAMHELFARGFERYMREGKSPSDELRGLFSRFQAWLVRLYDRATKLNAPINDDVREVFDRMLATEDQIARAKQRTGQTELIAKSAEELGVTEAEYQEILRLSVEAQDAAKEQLLAEVMRPLAAAERAEREALRAGIAADVEREFAARPEHRVIQWLGNERWIGVETLPEGMPTPESMRFDREMFVDQYGLDRLKRLPRGRRAMYTTGSAMTPDDVAGWFGFPSGDAMLDAIEAAPNLADAVKAETRARLLEQAGDPLMDGSIGDAAVAAINGDKRGALLEAELRALSRNATRSTPRTTRSALREIARRRIAMMPAREATRTEAYLSAMRRVGEKAQLALAKGDYDAAYDAKRQELLQHALFMESRKAAEELKSLENRIARLRRKTTRGNIDGEYLAAIDEIMDLYDFRKSTTQAEERRRGALARYIQMMVDSGRANELAIPDHVLARTQKVPYRTLPMQELRGVMQSIANIEHTGRRKKKLLDAKRQRELDEAAAKVANAIRENASGKSPGRTREQDSKAGDFARQYLNIALNADSLLRAYDGFTRGDAYDIIKEPIDDAGDDEQRMRTAAAQALEDLYSVFTPAEIRRYADTQNLLQLKTRGDKKAQFSKWDLISMALNMGNEENLGRLMDKDNGYGYSPRQIEFIKSQLTDRDWDFVQSVWDYLETYWPLISEREKRQTGVVPDKVAPIEVVTATGRTLRGGYYPIKYDRRLGAKVEAEQNAELVIGMLGGKFGKAQTRNGHTKERTGGSGGRVLELGMHVLHGHIGQVIHDLAFSEAVTNSWRILQHPDVVAAFEDTGRIQDMRSLELWLKDVAAGPMVPADVIGRMFLRLKNTFTLSKLALNIGTVLLQPTGIVQSMVVVGKRNFVKALLQYMQRPAEWDAEIRAISPFMAERQTTFQKDIYDMQGEMTQGPVGGRLTKAQQAFGRWGYYPMIKAQFYLVDLPVWIAGYNAGLEQFNGDEAKARKNADRMVARAQASGLMADRTGFERGTMGNMQQAAFIRLFTALGSYMFAKFNVAYETVSKGKRQAQQAENAGQMLTAVLGTSFDLVLLFVVEAMLYHAIRGSLPGDDEDDPEDWAKFIAKETALSFVGTVPVARDFAGAFTGFGSGGAYATIGDTIAAPFIQMSQGELDAALFKAVSNSAGLAVGLPSTFINRIGESTMRLAEGEDVSPMEFLVGRPPQ